MELLRPHKPVAKLSCQANKQRICPVSFFDFIGSVRVNAILDPKPTDIVRKGFIMIHLVMTWQETFRPTYEFG